MPHVHIGVVEFVTTCAYVILFTLFMRTLAARLGDTTTGRAVAAVTP